MHSSTVVTSCLIIAIIVTESASALSFAGPQDRSKRLFWVDKKSAKEDARICVRPAAATDIAKCFLSDCLKNQIDCAMICEGEPCRSLCNADKIECAIACLRAQGGGDIMSQ